MADIPASHRDLLRAAFGDPLLRKQRPPPRHQGLAVRSHHHLDLAEARLTAEFGGQVLQSDPAGATSAGHHSVLKVGDRHVIAYHRRPLEETNRHHRVTCLEWMDFDENGKIVPVKLTNEGVG